MNERQIREQVVATARSYIGCNEGDGSHKQIIDIYNSQRPLPRGYAVKYTDEWCATFVSAIGVELGMTDIILPECSCPKMINLYAAKGLWMENDAYVPAIGDIMMYAWSDNGVGDNRSGASHVGIVEAVNGNTITVIEGNYSNSVKRRNMVVNGKYIRGYCLPNYASKATEAKKSIEEVARDVINGKYGSGSIRIDKLKAEGYDYKEVQLKVNELLGVGKKPEYTYTKEQFIREVQAVCGANVDGIAGSETLRKTVTVSAYYNRKHPVVKAIQKYLYAIGYTQIGSADGIAGSKFTKAVKDYQKANGCIVDGVVTARNKTWKKLLGLV